MRRSVVALFLCVVASAADAQAATWTDGLFSETRHEFGCIPRGSDQRCSFVLTNTTEVPIRISGLYRTCGCTQITLDERVVLDQNTKAARENMILQPGQRAHLGVVLDTRSFIGPKTAEITVSFDQPSTADVRLTVNSFIRQDIVFNPGSAQLGTLSRGQEVNREVDIEYAGTAPWQILSVTNTNPNLDVKYEESYRKPGQVGYRLTIHLKPTAPPGFIRDAVVVETNDPSAPQFSVYVAGHVQPDLIVTPSSLSMGTVKPGQSVTRQILLRGKKPFQVTRVEGGGEAFQVEKPEGSHTFHRVIVRFAGSDELGKREGTFRVQTDLADESAEFRASVQVVR